MSLFRYLNVLRSLPFVMDASLVSSATGGSADAMLDLRTPSRKRSRLRIEQKAGVLNRAMAERIISRTQGDPPGTWIVFAPFVTTALGRLFAEADVNYVDEAGNCRLAIGGEYVAHIEGRKRIKSTSSEYGRITANGYQLLFALLLREELVRAPIRHMAYLAGLKKTTAAEALDRLQKAGLVLKSATGRQVKTTGVLDRWILGYSDMLRPRLAIGRFEGAERDPEQLTARLERALEGLDTPWAWGGGAAAYRLLGHFRGDETVLHVGPGLDEPTRSLRVLPKDDGRLILVRAPGPIAFEERPAPHIAPALLIYSELLLVGTERSREAAEQVRMKYLRDLS